MREICYKVTELKKSQWAEPILVWGKWDEANGDRYRSKASRLKMISDTRKYKYIWPILVRVLLKAIVKVFHNLMLWTLGKIPPILNPNKRDSPLHSPFYFITSFSQNWPLSVCPIDFGLLKCSHSSTSQARQYPAQSCWCGRCPRSPRVNQTHTSHKMCSYVGRNVPSQTRFVMAFPKVVFI